MTSTPGFTCSRGNGPCPERIQAGISWGVDLGAHCPLPQRHTRECTGSLEDDGTNILSVTLGKLCPVESLVPIFFSRPSCKVETQGLEDQELTRRLSPKLLAPQGSRGNGRVSGKSGSKVPCSPSEPTKPSRAKIPIQAQTMAIGHCLFTEVVTGKPATHGQPSNVT